MKIPLFIAMSACLAESPLLDDPAVQGDYEDGDEEHRPGQPCLLCHGDGHFPVPPGEERFEIAGTVYGGIMDLEDQGLEGVEVTITDADNREFTVVSNRAGNFMVEVSGDVNAPTQRRRGRLDIPWKPTYPLSVRIQRGADRQDMETKMWRNGDCAHCHGAAPDVDSVGRVYLFAEVP